MTRTVNLLLQSHVYQSERCCEIPHQVTICIINSIRYPSVPHIFSHHLCLFGAISIAITFFNKPVFASHYFHLRCIVSFVPNSHVSLILPYMQRLSLLLLLAILRQITRPKFGFSLVSWICVIFRVAAFHFLTVSSFCYASKVIAVIFLFIKLYISVNLQNNPRR